MNVFKQKIRFLINNAEHSQNISFDQKYINKCLLSVKEQTKVTIS